MILLTYHISISQANRCRRKLAAATPAKYERDLEILRYNLAISEIAKAGKLPNGATDIHIDLEPCRY